MSTSTIDLWKERQGLTIARCNASVKNSLSFRSAHKIITFYRQFWVYITAIFVGISHVLETDIQPMLLPRESVS